MKATTLVLIGATIALVHGKVKHHHHHRTHHGPKPNFRDLGPRGLELFLNSTSGLVGLLNATNHVAVVFDISSTTVLLLNGLGGNGIAIDGHSHALLKITGLWSATDSHFELYFRQLSCLEAVKLGQSATRAELEPDLTRLGAHLGLESSVLENLVGASTSLHQVALVLKVVMRQDHFTAKGGVLKTATVLRGIGDVFLEKPQELQRLVKNGTQLDLSAIINAPNGLQAFLRILHSLGSVDMRPIMSNPMGHLELSLHLMVELGGNDSDDGIDNVLRIVYNIVAFINGHGCLDCLIHALVEAGENGGVEINGADITPIIDDFLQLVEKQNSMYQGGEVFNVIIKFLRDLNTNNLLLNDINISKLLQLLSKDDYKGAIDMIVRFFMHFNNILNPTKSIPRFFGYFLAFLTTARGFRSAPQLLPGLDPSQIQGLQLINITNIGNTSSNPALDHICKQFSTSVGTASNNSLNFNDLLNQGGGWMFPPSAFGRFFGLGFFQPLQSFGNQNPLQGLLPGSGGDLPALGGANITNILVNSSVPCGTSTESEVTASPVTETTVEVGSSESRVRRRNHHEHGRKESRHQTHHHTKHLKHHDKTEKNHAHQ